MKKNSAILLGIAGLATSLFVGDAVAQGVARAPSRNAKAAISEHVIGPCQVRIANMFGGKFIASHADSYSPQQGIYDLPDSGPQAPPVLSSFSLFCWKASDDELDVALNARQVDGHWLSSGPSNGPDFVPFDRQAHVQTIPLKRTNWTGRAYTADDTTGDERERARMFHFCLIHGEHALCGKTPVVWLAKPKVNEMWKVKAILESVEFVDAPSPVDTSSASRGSTSHP